MACSSTPVLLLVLLGASAWLTAIVPVVEASGAKHLKYSFYDKSCPQLHSIVNSIVTDEYRKDNTVPAPLLRLHFHDCFVQGCDGSILIDSTPGNVAEKDADPNKSLDGFTIIDSIKTAVEKVCPNTVSCADITALAGNYGVKLAGGPAIRIRLGRRDSRTSYASLAVKKLPGPTMTVKQLVENFAAANLTLVDMVTLSGAHTIGASHCDKVANRLPPNPRDPTLARSLRKYLVQACKAPKIDNNVTVGLDVKTPTRFDTRYYKNLQKRYGLLTSDQELMYDASTKDLVNRYADSRTDFFKGFRQSMVRMGEYGVLTGSQGEIRKQCSRVN
eukprot:TRINITY_DN1487_c0_g1_i1.p1 TRINITY_DN1487_c0_g1~~TRINITY_DN1487_c0_g1_i1.p1  ORF type:complete len:331 (-),score=21.52 TRINITY_DN1487_c0_g1_i1:440-1432(-)